MAGDTERNLIIFSDSKSASSCLYWLVQYQEKRILFTLRESTIIPIAKPGKDSKDPNNYRPIALTSCVCKTMERMINDRLVWYLESSLLITEAQSGFLKTQSTMDHLVRFETFVREGFLNRKRGIYLSRP